MTVHPKRPEASFDPEVRKELLESIARRVRKGYLFKVEQGTTFKSYPVSANRSGMKHVTMSQINKLLLKS
jgi:hypothetical protein